MGEIDLLQKFSSDETAKWEKITYLGIATCTVLAIFNLSKGHPHHEEPAVSFLISFLNLVHLIILFLKVLLYALSIMSNIWLLTSCMQPYTYLHIRNKEFPWGMFLLWINLSVSLAKKKNCVFFYNIDCVNYIDSVFDGIFVLTFNLSFVVIWLPVEFGIMCLL